MGEQIYRVQRLNTWTPESWAVINCKTGAIVLDAGGRLAMKMSFRTAQTLAERLTQSIDASSPVRVAGPTLY